VIDHLLALWVDRDTCKPYTGAGRVGHVVRVSDSPNMTIINEFADGGRFEHADCAPASLQSWLIDRSGVKTSIQEIERIAGTNLNGTGWKGVEAAGVHFGLQFTFTPNNPPAGWIMNPGGGFIEQPSAFPAYLAATQGGCLVLPDLTVKPPVKPTPQPILEDDVTILAMRSPGSVDPHGAGAVYLVKDAIYGPKRWVTAMAFPTYEAALGAPKIINAFILDRMEEGPHIDAVASPPEA
jgi:hypothetical protein